MNAEFGLLVTDASPLITLAAADALSCLTRLGLPIIIPDMVYVEVTQDMARLGASQIVDWVREAGADVRIVPTRIYSEFEALRMFDPKTRSRGRGEQAALEILNAELARLPETHAFLLFEDSDVGKRSFVRALPENVAAISTGDLLRELEFAGLIQSADHIIDAALAANRNVERQRDDVERMTDENPLRDHLKAAR